MEPRQKKATYSEAFQIVRTSWRELLPSFTGPALSPVNGEQSWICPLCGHGTNGDGLTFDPTSRDGNTLKCFGCNFTGDIADLYGEVTGTATATAVKELAARLGYTFEAEPQQQSRACLKRGESYLKGCAELLKQSREAEAYLTKRGISLETAIAHGLGYEPNWQSPTALERGKNPPRSKRILIPTGGSSYIARAIEDTEPKWSKMNEGEVKLFNAEALYSEGEGVFITEGAIDALSIIEAGGTATALNSVSNRKLLTATLEAKKPATVLFLALDGDSAGKTATRELAKELDRLNIPYLTADINCGYKDANEALVADREALKKAIADVQCRASATPYSVQTYLKQGFSDDIRDFTAGCLQGTGFANLDKECNGLYAGLYVVAAISSLGKTTFCHQLADWQAQQGRDVLFFSLEQSRLELVSKSIARRAYLDSPYLELTSLNIRKGNWGDRTQVARIIEEYGREVGSCMNIIEGNFNCTPAFIREMVKNHIRRTGKRPVVFVDYLQILQPSEDRKQTTKEAIDTTITELKRLSREYGIPVVAISSVNRANYASRIDFEALKESGSIEYSADVVFGLQLQCVNRAEFLNTDKVSEKREIIRSAKAENPRRIQLCCLKNRYGKTSFDCDFEYYPRYDYFRADYTRPATEKARKVVKC